MVLEKDLPLSLPEGERRGAPTTHKAAACAHLTLNKEYPSLGWPWGGVHMQATGASGLFPLALMANPPWEKGGSTCGMDVTGCFPCFLQLPHLPEKLLFGMECTADGCILLEEYADFFGGGVTLCN